MKIDLPGACGGATLTASSMLVSPAATFIGAAGMRRMLDVYPKAIWLNPEPQRLLPCRQPFAVAPAPGMAARQGNFAIARAGPVSSRMCSPVLARSTM
jgi:hypothetical protein